MNGSSRDKEISCLNSDVKPTDEEILEQARYLGIDSSIEPELLWIAKESWLCELPEPWIAAEDEKKNIYFYNPETKVSMWEHPYDGFYKNMIQQERSGRMSRITNSSPEDSGVAGLTRSSLRSTPLQPISQMAKSIPQKLSIDFLSSPSNNLKKTSSLKPMEEKSPIAPLSAPFELDSNFGKHSFLKTDRRSSSDLSKDSSAAKAVGEDINAEPSKVRFNLDLDENSDPSHYSYLETVESESCDLGLADASDLMNTPDIDDYEASSKKHFSSNLTKNSNDPKYSNSPKTLPSKAKNEESLSSKSSSRAVNRMLQNDERELNEIEIKSEVSQKEREFNHELGELVKKFENEKSSIIYKHTISMEEEESNFRQMHDDLKKEHEEKLKKLREEHDKLFSLEKNTLIEKLAKDMAAVEKEEIEKLRIELAKKVSQFKDSFENEKLQKYNSEEKLLKESHERQVEKLKNTFKNEIEQEEQRYSSNLNSLKMELKAENEAEMSKLRENLAKEMHSIRSQHDEQMASMRRELQEEIFKMENEYSKRKEDRMKNLQNSQDDEINSAQRSFETQLSTYKEKLKRETEELVSEFNRAKEDLSIAFRSENVAAKSRAQESEKQVMFNELAKLRNELDRLKFDVDAEKSNLQILHEKRMLADKSLQTRTSYPYTGSVEQDILPAKLLPNSFVNPTSLSKQATFEEPKANIAEVSKLLEPIYKELSTINCKVDELKVQNSASKSEELTSTFIGSIDEKLVNNRQEDFPQIAASLVDVSSQITNLLQDLRFPIPDTVPRLSNAEDSFDPSAMSQRPFVVDLAKDSLYSSLNASPSILNHIGSSILHSNSYEPRKSFYRFDGPPVRQRLDAQKQWLKEYQNQRKHLPSYF